MADEGQGPGTGPLAFNVITVYLSALGCFSLRAPCSRHTENSSVIGWAEVVPVVLAGFFHSYKGGYRPRLWLEMPFCS